MHFNAFLTEVCHLFVALIPLKLIQPNHYYYYSQGWDCSGDTASVMLVVLDVVLLALMAVVVL